jgi:hypothetical protein
VFNILHRHRHRQRQAKQAHTAEVAELALHARGMCVDAMWAAAEPDIAYRLTVALDEYDRALRLIRARLDRRPDLARIIDQTIVV